MSIHKLSINVVTSNKPKMLGGLAQNGKAAGTGICLFPVMDTQAVGGQRAPNPFVSILRNVVSPYRSPRRITRGRDAVRQTDNDAGMGVGQSERRPVIGRIRVAP